MCPFHSRTRHNPLFLKSDKASLCDIRLQILFSRRVSGKAFRNSFFGHGTGKIAYSSVKCNGTEIDVMHCTLKEVAVPTCDHSNEAGVSCSCKPSV